MGKVRDSFSNWLKPGEALKAGKAQFGDKAYKIILDRLKAGMLTAVADSWSESAGVSPAIPHHDRTAVPSALWPFFAHGDFWETGDAHFQRTPYMAAIQNYWYFGVRFDPAEIREIFPPPPTSEVAEGAPVPPAAAKGGRPRKEYWDQLWAETCAAIYNGALTPTRQSDVEKWMLNWAAANGHDISEQAIRTRARLLMAALREDKN